jgi:hypothetical protein
MKSTRIALATLGLLSLAGVWLFVAPFGLSLQPLTTPWHRATLNDVAAGGALILIGLTALASYCALAVRDLLARAQASNSDPAEEAK